MSEPAEAGSGWILALPTKTSEMRLFEFDNGTMSQARLAREVWDYERYAGHRVWRERAAPTAARSRSGSATATPAPSVSRCCTSSWRARRSTCSTTAARRSPPT
ncbi:replication-relaxation family protein [Streptomyces sp. NPDC006259]|uniref:replication-relaxation family protein n=1 Tax=Streptomyces sp. NPDC006259 TaxID=3364740 RepID=UPI0036B62360